GEEVRAPVVVGAVHPRRTFLEQVDRAELPADFVADLERWRSRSGVVKVNLALAELPDFAADPGSHPQEHHSGAIELALSPAYVEQAFQDAKAGRAALRRRLHPQRARPDPVPGRRPRDVAVCPVVPARVGRRAPPGGAGGL